MRFKNVVYLICCLYLLSCNSSEKTEDPDLCEVQSDFIGNWKGTVIGTNGTPSLPSYGTAIIKLQFKADGKMIIEADDPTSKYCPVAGEWCISTSKSKFFAEGKDCDNITIRFGSPSNLHLIGTWTASSGREGTFDITKQ